MGKGMAQSGQETRDETSSEEEIPLTVDQKFVAVWDALRMLSQRLDVIEERINNAT